MSAIQKGENLKNKKLPWEGGMKIIIQEFNESLVFGVYGRKREIKELNNQHFNFGATNSKITWVNEGETDEDESFGLWWSSHASLLSYCYNLLEMRFARKTGYEFNGVSHLNRLKQEAKNMFNNMMDNLQTEKFVNYYQKY